MGRKVVGFMVVSVHFSCTPSLQGLVGMGEMRGEAGKRENMGEGGGSGREDAREMGRGCRGKKCKKKWSSNRI